MPAMPAVDWTIEETNVPTPDATAETSCAETHISWVLFTEERAFKVYKPLATDVLDHHDAARRRAACQREVALNVRLAPDVYQGVGEIMLDGTAIEPVIVMRRLPSSRRLSALLDTPDAPRLVRSVARTVASFHAGLPALDPDDAERVAGSEALASRWADDVDGLITHGGDAIAETAEEIERLAAAYLAGRGPLLAQRIADGQVRDGHGDLLADDIFCLDDGPRILDCLAFSDELRWGDVLADVGFLVMDLQRLGHPTLARAFLTAYCEFSGEHHPGSLAHFSVAQRALVRAKVAAQRATQTGGPRSEAGTLARLALDHLRRAEICLTLVGGLPGSGKSTLAGQLGDELGWTVLSSDDVRRDLGLRARDAVGARAYEPETVAAVYAEMRRRAERLMGLGHSVILDATWTSAAERDTARALASAAHARLVEVNCRAPLSVCRDRVHRRGTASTSEATSDVVDLLASRADPWPEATPFESARPESAGNPTVSARVTGLWWSSTASTSR